jgi:hypothetical protein
MNFFLTDLSGRHLEEKGRGKSVKEKGQYDIGKKIKERKGKRGEKKGSWT